MNKNKNDEDYSTNDSLKIHKKSLPAKIIDYEYNLSLKPSKNRVYNYKFTTNLISNNNKFKNKNNFLNYESHCIKKKYKYLQNLKKITDKYELLSTYLKFITKGTESLSENENFEAYFNFLFAYSIINRYYYNKENVLSSKLRVTDSIFKNLNNKNLINISICLLKFSNYNNSVIIIKQVLSADADNILAHLILIYNYYYNKESSVLELNECLLLVKKIIKIIKKYKLTETDNKLLKIIGIKFLSFKYLNNLKNQITFRINNYNQINLKHKYKIMLSNIGTIDYYLKKDIEFCYNLVKNYCKKYEPIIENYNYYKNIKFYTYKKRYIDKFKSITNLYKNKIITKDQRNIIIYKVFNNKTKKEILKQKLNDALFFLLIVTLSFVYYNLFN